MLYRQLLPQTYTNQGVIGARWAIERMPYNSFYNQEGSKIGFKLTLTSPIPNCSIRIFAANLGSVENNNNWSATWTQMCQEEAARHTGVTYTPTSDATHSILTTGIFTFSSAYDGAPIIIERFSQLDATTEGDLQLDVFIDSQSTGTVVRSVASLVIQDVSLTPPGSTTFRARRDLPSGSSIAEGESVQITLVTENMKPGQSCVVKAVNTGSSVADWVQTFTAAWQAACAAVPGVTYTVTNPAQGTITWGAAYSDASPVVFTRTVAADNSTEAASEQCDFIFDTFSAGFDRIYTRTVSVFIQDTSQSQTVPAFQVRMQPSQPNPGDTITYTLSSESGVVGGGSVVVGQSGDATDADFNMSLDDLMAALVASEPANLSYNSSTKTVTVSAAWSGTATASRTISPSSTADKHIVSLSSPGGGAVIVVKEDVCFIGGSGAVVPFSFASGINLSGAEFGSGGLINGQAAMNYHAGKGFGIARFPFKWEWAQTSQNGSLSTNFNSYVNIVKYWTNTKGKFALLDCHSFGKYNNVPFGVNSGTDIQSLCDLWVRVIAAMQTASVDMSKILIDPMNEPGLNTVKWRRFGQAVTNAIRARTTFLGMIVMEGSGSSPAYDWIGSGIGAEMLNYYDPAGNHCFSPHQYLDNDSSGTKGTCSVDAAKRLDAVTAWAITNNKKLFLGEFAWGDESVSGQEQCGAEFPSFMNKMRNNKNAWMGWTWWGAGQFWPYTSSNNYFFRLDPVKADRSAYDYSGASPDTQQMYDLSSFIENLP